MKQLNYHESIFNLRVLINVIIAIINQHEIIDNSKNNLLIMDLHILFLLLVSSISKVIGMVIIIMVLVHYYDFNSVFLSLIFNLIIPI